MNLQKKRQEQVQLFANKTKSSFPAIQQKMGINDLCYLDSAATSLKPLNVIQRVNQFNSFEVSNVHRGAHKLGDQATQMYESARKTVAHFINARSDSEIVFVRGTTEAINLLANTLTKKLTANDEVLLTQLEHHSNIVPWQLASSINNFKIKFAPVQPSAALDVEKLKLLITEKTKIVSLTHASNHTGEITPLKSIVEAAHKVGAIVVVDGAQAIGKIAIDMQDLDCDFYVFSGHKMFAPFGIGALYGKAELLNELPPYQGGGSMITSVTESGSQYLPAPQRFEAGTPNVEGAIGLQAAIEFIENIGISEIQKFEEDISYLALQELRKINGLKIIGDTIDHRLPVIAFTLDNAHHSDVAQILDEQGIAVRAGHHCTQPLLNALKLTGSIRASFSVFNDVNDINKLINGIKKAQEILL